MQRHGVKAASSLHWTQRIRLRAAIAVLGGAGWCAGCVTYAPHVDRLAADLDREVAGWEIESAQSYKLGRISLGLAKGVTRMVLPAEDDEERAALSALKGLRRVEFGTYRATGAPPDRLPEEIESSLERRGWETLARFQDHGELGWVLYRMDRDDRLRQLVVLALDHDELTVVRLGGRLDRVVTAGLQLARWEVLEGERYLRDDEMAEIGLGPDGEEPGDH